MRELSSYYLSEKSIHGLGDMWILEAFHEASFFGGEGLVGSASERLRAPPLGLTRFPSPFALTATPTVLSAIYRNRKEIGGEVAAAATPQSLIQTAVLAGVQQSITIEHKDSFKAGTDTLPMVDASIGLNVDYDRMVKMAIALGAGARVKAIPKGSLMGLYKVLKGDAARVEPESPIRIDNEYIVDQVLVVNDFSYSFESSVDFNLEMEAKVKMANVAPNASIQFKFASKRTLQASITNGVDYVVGLHVVRWHDLRP